MFRRREEGVTSRQDTKDLVWLNVATEIAALSKDPSTKVGALILGADGVVVSTGRNGMAQGIDETGLWDDREIKYDNVIHAEENALIFADYTRCKGAAMYCSFCPCWKCIRLIKQAGIVRVVSWRPTEAQDARWDFGASYYRLEQYGVSLTLLEAPRPTSRGPYDGR